ncbi:acetoacetate decarboxylase family protein [Nocardia sp. NPDC057663]|uniref:acetoacetate decarboxylase family protein n=1 Tax=Nocardia sp. NPDC057663 TaxID=3346201 RepID=UPI00366C3690
MPSTEHNTVAADLGGVTVMVPEGGLYDRYRMNTDLDEVARDPRVHSVDYFRQLPKAEVDSRIGTTRTPNFYYRLSSARLTMLAPTRAIRSRLPAELAPLEVIPGLGLVSVMFFSYDICDIDAYTEAAVGIAVRPAQHRRLGFVDLLAALGNDDFDSYVVSLPVNTDIAYVRGHDGYGFPKWRTDIEVDIDSDRATGHVANSAGGTDLSLSVATPAQTAYPSGERISTLTSYTKIDHAWHAILGQTNVLSTGSAALPRRAQLRVGRGRMADDLRSLKPIKTIRLDVTTEAQLALHMPVPISVPTRARDDHRRR